MSVLYDSTKIVIHVQRYFKMLQQKHDISMMKAAAEEKEKKTTKKEEQTQATNQKLLCVLLLYSTHFQTTNQLNGTIHFDI